MVNKNKNLEKEKDLGGLWSAIGRPSTNEMPTDSLRRSKSALEQLFGTGSRHKNRTRWQRCKRRRIRNPLKSESLTSRASSRHGPCPGLVPGPRPWSAACRRCCWTNHIPIVTSPTASKQTNNEGCHLLRESLASLESSRILVPGLGVRSVPQIHQTFGRGGETSFSKNP